MWSYDAARFGRINSGSSNNHMKGFGSAFEVPTGRLCLSLGLNDPLQVWGGPLRSVLRCHQAAGSIEFLEVFISSDTLVWPSESPL
jgi:hypothetical protein